MAFDREDTLKRAEKLLRQGRLEAAIEGYLRVVEEQPLDWVTANMLGDLYVRAAQSDKAVAQYTRIAEHLHAEGFFSKAAALYKKILKIKPDDERAQLSLAEVSLAQGLLADAKSHFSAVATRRRAGGDAAGAEDIVIRRGAIDDGDLDARAAAARILAQRGDVRRAAAHFRAIHDVHADVGRHDLALAALREAVDLNPADTDTRALLATEAIRAGELELAREYMIGPDGTEDPSLLARLLELEFRAGREDQAREIAAKLVRLDGSAARVVETGWTMTADHPEGALACVEYGVDEAVAALDFTVGAALLQEFVSRVHGHIPALLRLVELCVDGGLAPTMYDAQASLAEAYLAVGQPAEARVIAEDLLSHEPRDAAHADRLRRALVACGVEDPEAVLAERLAAETADELAGADSIEPTEAEPATVALESGPILTAPAYDGRVSAPEPGDFSPLAACPVLPIPPVAGHRPGARPDPVPETSVPPQPPPVPGPPPSAPADELLPMGTVEIDLTEALAELQAGAAPLLAPPPKPASLEEVFQEIREGTSKDAVATEAADQMKLGRMYQEMGMTDDALQAFRKAARWPTERFEAAMTLARLHMQRGERLRAVEWMERAAQVPAPTPEAGRQLLYYLGVTLEDSGETARALAVFLELQADASDYRDVASRVQRLARVEAGG